MRIGFAQISGVWLDREAGLAKVVAAIEEAGADGCSLLAFGEALVPGYPFWIERTDGARFQSDVQRDFHAHYLDQAVCLEEGHLTVVQEACRAHGVAIYLGCIERPADRGGHSVYCSLVYIDTSGVVGSVHRKLMPTYEERLSWSTGDGHGLRTHRLGAFTVGGLNCWENWMPMARAALYAQGEDLHVAVWPGNVRNVVDITRMIAMESRSYVLSVCGLLRSAEDIPVDIPHRDTLIASAGFPWAEGGSCVAAPDGSWLIEPLAAQEGYVGVNIEHAAVRRARHDFDPSGHYSRPDVLSLRCDRRRQSAVELQDEG